MKEMLINLLVGGSGILVVIGMYFFVATHGSLWVQRCWHCKYKDIYWLYKNPYLIWFTDRQPLISTILLGKYFKMTSDIIKAINQQSVANKRILQIGCAFGQFSQKIAENCRAESVSVVDLIKSEIINSRSKIGMISAKSDFNFIVASGAPLPYKDETFNCVILFFLFHELPIEEKAKVLKEASRVLKVGGEIVFAEFHRPFSRLLRVSGRCFFWVFEPYAKEMWNKFEPIKVLNQETPNKWRDKRITYLMGNYQVLRIKKIN
ncbi:MAG: class I SAM-dependent methyltransferase [Patescibacteria group bacterium]